MKKFLLFLMLMGCLLSVFASSSSATPILYANEVLAIHRGTTEMGNFYPDYYGGSFPGDYPVTLTESQAIDAVLGAPDTNFLSLPGGESTGSAGSYAFVEVGFGQNFTANSQIIITELGDSGESAVLWLFMEDGSSLQPVITRGADDVIIYDLSLNSHVADLTAVHGDFTSIGIRGRDLNGASYGFDLDAIGITAPVPEPATLLLLGSGLIGLPIFRRKFKKN